ncbi:piggyBac transposable element-derived protein 4 isoform X1 [Larimichthys crocea]|uniref:piggyBac transposable element-derived protein 4 isoform X1 n=1 Tax=Larimichthys crocea TaxID=215358 RepID=UPI000F5F39A8|nr:piggyBac transposable element-derived protein 4 isoform X1 [Larimichthys crocea]
MAKLAGVLIVEMATEQKSTQEMATEQKSTQEMATEQKSTQEMATEQQEMATEQKSAQEMATEQDSAQTEQDSAQETATEQDSAQEMATAQKSAQEMATAQKSAQEDEDGSSSSTEDSESEEEDEGSEVDPDKLESESDSSEDSSEEEDREKMDEPTAGWTSKNGKIVWSPTNDETLRYVPQTKGRLTPGPTHYAIARISDPLSSFALLLTDEILQYIVDMTNLQGRRSVAGWRDVDKEELQAYVGLLVLSGLYRSRNESTLSLWGEKWGRAIFRATMSHKRFHHLSRALRFDNEQSRRRSRDDRMAAFRKVWDMWTHRLPMLFNPDRDICVDEQLVPFKGKCSFRQYMPKKPAKYGIKIWATCDVKTSYAWRLQVYTGKVGGKPEVNQGMRVVLDMTQGLKGNIITCDNFFTSFALTEELLKRKLALVGTIRRNKPELPPNLLQARAVFSSMFAFTKNHTLVSYIPKRGKNVLLLSTKHRSPDISDEMKKKPIIIHDYNRCKGGVDTLDKVVATYSCRRKTQSWPLALFHNLIDVSLYNAYVLWKSVDPSWHQQKSHRRRLYIQEVGEMLVTPHIKKRGRLPRSSAANELVKNLHIAAAGPSPIIKAKGGRRLCNLCTGKKKRVSKSCGNCGRFTCKDHRLIVCSACCVSPEFES